MSSTFESLRFRNYRIWFFAALVANAGSWMQRVAQDWLVLRVLTDDSASATGLTTALQFLPVLLFSAHAGLLADRVDQRRLLLLTQGSMGLVSLVLGLAVLAGRAELWHVYLAAFLTGLAVAYDAPARQIFVARMVPASDLANAVGLNSASFNAARLIGPAAAGLVIAWVGPGWVFIVNALSFLFPTLALVVMRSGDLLEMPRAERAKGQLREGLAYVRGRSDLVVIIAVVSLVSMLTLNFQVTMAAMVRSAFDLESEAYGTVSSIFAVGSLTGSLWAARRRAPRVRTVVVAAFMLGVSSLLMALAPSYWLFALSSVPVGLCVLTLLTSANQTVQLTTAPQMRGRVMSIYMMFFLGTTPLGAPLIGWVSDLWGPRAAIAVGGAAAVLVALVAAWWVRRHWRVDLRYSHTRPYLRTVGPRERADQRGQQEPDRPDGYPGRQHRGPRGPRVGPASSSSGGSEDKRKEGALMSELIDTTEMYLKTVYELEEDGVLPLRARIVERLAHSGPTVSQTVARMERDGLIRVAEDRSLELTEEGRRRATEVIRKHRLAERLLLDVIGLDRRLVHEEACRWEHVMSEQVEDRLVAILQEPSTDPFGNPVPERAVGRPHPADDEISADRAARDGEVAGTVRRIGEPIQADGELLSDLEEAGVVAGAPVSLRSTTGGVRVVSQAEDPVVLPNDVARHLFLRR